MEGLSKGDKVESEYPFFLLYLRSLTSGTITRLSMIKMASEKAVFGNMAPYLNKILVLSTVWRYPQAKAVEFMSQRVPTKDFSKFLYKFLSGHVRFARLSVQGDFSVAQDVFYYSFYF